MEIQIEQGGGDSLQNNQGFRLFHALFLNGTFEAFALGSGD